MKDKFARVALKHRDAAQVAGHQIGGELHPRELQTKAARQRVRQRGFTHAGHIFNQQVATGQEADDRIAHLFGLADDDLIELLQELGNGGLHRRRKKS